MKHDLEERDPEIIEDITVSAPPPVTKSRKPRAKKNAAAAQSFEADIAVMADILSAGTYVFWEEYHDILPNAEEWSLVLIPIARILSRHMAISPALTPDVRDMLAIFTVLACYGMRVQMTVKAKKEANKEHKYDTERPNPRFNQGSDQQSKVEYPDNILPYFGQAIP